MCVCVCVCLYVVCVCDCVSMCVSRCVYVEFTVDDWLLGVGSLCVDGRGGAECCFGLSMCVRENREWGTGVRGRVANKCVQ